MPPAPVVHLLPYDVARGSQVYARAVCDLLDRDDDPHRIVTLFDGPPVLLRPDDTLGVTAGRLRTLGLDPRVLFRLGSWLHHRPVRAIVAHGGEAYKYAALVAPRGLPIVYYRIGAVLPAARRLPGRWWHAALLRRAAMVACVSDDVRVETQELFGVPKARTAVIPNARDPAVYYPSPRQARPVVSIGFVGQLMATKRPEWLLRAVATLRSEGIPVDGVLVGDGALAPDLNARAPTAGVRYLGPSGDIPAVLRDLDVLLLPSTLQEGMPGIIIEAALSGLPVVATDVPGVRDVISPEETGIIVGADDLDAAIDALRRLAIDREMRDRMGRAARIRCEERFSLGSSADAWRRLLGEVSPLRC
jgi:glycosyltransferase involved in cell wall biosynthesis